MKHRSEGPRGSFFLLGFLCGADASGASAATHTPFLDQIEAALDATPVGSVDGCVGTLPESYQGKYHLVYGSRSVQSATLERPRVILRSPDNQVFIAFADSKGSKPADQQVEMIENYGLD